jgi:hypothetical protein
MGMLLNAYFSIIQNVLPIVELIKTKKALDLSNAFLLLLKSILLSRTTTIYCLINFEDETTSSIVAVIT